MAQMSFRLRIGERDILLRPGKITLGRSEECTVLLDDALLSRVHARLVVSKDEVVVEDLGSKNGTYVNEERLKGPSRLHNGDQIRVGHTRMTLAVIRRRTSSAQSRARTLGFTTQVDEVEPGGDPTDVLFRMVQVGRLEEAAKLLKSRVAQLTSGDPFLAVNHIMARSVQEGLLAMADQSMDGIWLHRLFKLHVRCGWFMAEGVQRRAQQLVRAVGNPGGDGLVAYMSLWAARADQLTAEQRQQLDRLTDLASRQR